MRPFSREAALAFVRAHTVVASTPLLPEIRLHLASEITPLWQATEVSLEVRGVAPPYWAFAWVGGQALARYVLDRPQSVRGRRVLDFAAGSGIAGIAAVRRARGRSRRPSSIRWHWPPWRSTRPRTVSRSPP